MPGSLGRHIAAGLLWGGLLAPASAQAIFTCVDAKGRRLTADRPIPECLDREQKELTPGGAVKRRIGPELTGVERAAAEAKARKAAEERTRLAEDKKRERALLMRYPDNAAHDKERATALNAVDSGITAAHKSTNDLAAQRKRLNTELEFYKGDPSKVPPQLKRQIDENQHHMEAQGRFIANQDNERKRINARFDEERAKLQELWASIKVPIPVGTGAHPTRPASSSAAR